MIRSHYYYQKAVERRTRAPEPAPKTWWACGLKPGHGLPEPFSGARTIHAAHVGEHYLIVAQLHRAYHGVYCVGAIVPADAATGILNAGHQVTDPGFGRDLDHLWSVATPENYRRSPAPHGLYPANWPGMTEGSRP